MIPATLRGLFVGKNRVKLAFFKKKVFIFAISLV